MTATDATSADPTAAAAPAEGQAPPITAPGTDTKIPTADGQAPTEGATADTAGAQDKQQPTGDDANVAGDHPYEFTAPDGGELDTGLVEAFEPLARKHGMSQEGAQEVIDAVTPLIGDRIVKAVEEGIAERDQARTTEWENEARKDKEIGGTKLAPAIQAGRELLKQFGNEDLITLLRETGLGSSPAMIRFMSEAGKAISEESTFLTGGKTVPGRMTEAQLQSHDVMTDNLFGESK